MLIVKGNLLDKITKFTQSCSVGITAFALRNRLTISSVSGC